MQIPARTRIHIPVFALHRSVALWDNPNAFVFEDSLDQCFACLSDVRHVILV
jgi:cytochrome P450